jgi:ATP-dependent RNA helicase DDX24/MAK5
VRRSDDERKVLKHKKLSAKVNGLKAQLAQELSQPLMAHGVSARYITSGKGGQDRFVDSILADKQHQHLIGRTKKNAFDDVQQELPAQKAKKSGKGLKGKR